MITFQYEISESECREVRRNSPASFTHSQAVAQGHFPLFASIDWASGRMLAFTFVFMQTSKVLCQGFQALAAPVCNSAFRRSGSMIEPIA
jgi:hypothetical protein